MTKLAAIALVVFNIVSHLLSAIAFSFNSITVVIGVVKSIVIHLCTGVQEPCEYFNRTSLEKSNSTGAQYCGNDQEI